MVKNWEIDKTHSQICFRVKHLGLNTISGYLRNYKGVIRQFSPKSFENSKFDFSGCPFSICTANEDRDTHLMSADFFDSENYATIEFSSNGVEQIDDFHYFISGKLNIKGCVNEIQLTAHYKGSEIGISGNERIGFELTGQLNRVDFNMAWNGVNKNGIHLLDDNVQLHMDLQLIKQ